MRYAVVIVLLVLSLILFWLMIAGVKNKAIAIMRIKDLPLDVELFVAAKFSFLFFDGLIVWRVNEGLFTQNKYLVSGLGLQLNAHFIVEKDISGRHVKILEIH